MRKPAEREDDHASVRSTPAVADDPFGLAPWLKEMPAVPLHPLMIHPMAAFAASTAIGFGMAGQFAGMMFGAMQGATARAGAALEEAAELAVSTEAAIEREVVARPALTVVPSAEPKAARRKPAARKARVEAAPRRKTASARADAADDLKAIPGIGPKLEQVLNGMGYRRYGDIAGLTAADVEKLEAELGLGGRIARDGWVEQAKTLAKGKG